MTDEVILKHLSSGGADAEFAWKEFLHRFSNLFLKVIWQFQRDHDGAMEEYLFVCSRLAARRYAILRKFRDSAGPRPSLASWLTVVVRNLCIDHHRATRGRRRFPKALLKLSEYDRKVFGLYYWKKYSVEETDRLAHPRADGGALAALKRIENALTRTLSERLKPSPPDVLVPYDDTTIAAPIDDDVPDLEVHANTWLDKLSDQERIVIRMRFWEDLTAGQIAGILNIPSEQRVYSILRRALNQLRVLGTKCMKE
jgi:DNA-directed RNA polymerase specialized sigma24 family protein